MMLGMLSRPDSCCAMVDLPAAAAPHAAVLLRRCPPPPAGSQRCSTRPRRTCPRRPAQQQHQRLPRGHEAREEPVARHVRVAKAPAAHHLEQHALHLSLRVRGEWLCAPRPAAVLPCRTHAAGLRMRAARDLHLLHVERAFVHQPLLHLESNLGGLEYCAGRRQAGVGVGVGGAEEFRNVRTRWSAAPAHLAVWDPRHGENSCDEVPGEHVVVVVEPHADLHTQTQLAITRPLSWRSAEAPRRQGLRQVQGHHLDHVILGGATLALCGAGGRRASDRWRWGARSCRLPRLRLLRWLQVRCCHSAPGPLPAARCSARCDVRGTHDEGWRLGTPRAAGGGQARAGLARASWRCCCSRARPSALRPRAWSRLCTAQSCAGREGAPGALEAAASRHQCVRSRQNGGLGRCQGAPRGAARMLRERPARPPLSHLTHLGAAHNACRIPPVVLSSLLCRTPTRPSSTFRPPRAR